MCGRFKPNVDSWKELYEVLNMFGEEPMQLDLFVKDEIRPTNNYPIVRVGKDGNLETALARWSLLPYWFRKDLKDFTLTTFNAKIEEAADKATFKAAFAKRHCIVLVDYFWEWWGVRDDDPKKKQRQDIRRGDNHLMVFAGIWDKATLADGQMIESFTLMTRAAGDDLSSYHTREPVTLLPDEIMPWLRCEPVGSIGPVDNVWPSAVRGTFRFSKSAFVEPPPAPKKPKAKAGPDILL